jgi:2',3'-cyclic-nucleotide 2'-phosphodiesterase (5'-nucleotidase family)
MHFTTKLELKCLVQTQCDPSKRVSISFVFIFMQSLKLNFWRNFNSKYTSMSRLISGLLVILLTFSCSPHLSVNQISTANIPINVQMASIDSSVLSIVKPYHDSIEHDLSKLVTVSDSPLIKGKPESKLTNLMADILFEFGTSYCSSLKLNVKPDLSYINSGGIRASLPKGEITVGRMFELMPFENEVVLIRISGSSVQKMADRIASRGGEGIAGMKLGIRDLKPVNLQVGGAAIDTTASYWLVTNDYIANGGDQMSMFLNPIDRINTKMKIRDLLIQNLSDRYKKEGVLSVKLDGRISNEQ